jgi:hypothetical protein
LVFSHISPKLLVQLPLPPEPPPPVWTHRALASGGGPMQLHSALASRTHETTALSASSFPAPMLAAKHELGSAAPLTQLTSPATVASQLQSAAHAASCVAHPVWMHDQHAAVDAGGANVSALVAQLASSPASPCEGDVGMPFPPLDEPVEASAPLAGPPSLATSPTLPPHAVVATKRIDGRPHERMRMDPEWPGPARSVATRTASKMLVVSLV